MFYQIFEPPLTLTFLSVAIKIQNNRISVNSMKCQIFLSMFMEIVQVRTHSTIHYYIELPTHQQLNT